MRPLSDLIPVCFIVRPFSGEIEWGGRANTKINNQVCLCFVDNTLKPELLCT